MNYSGTADEGPEETDHKINRVIRGKDAEIAKTGSEGVDRSERDALLEIILVGHHTAFWAATSAGGIDNGGHVAALTRNESRFPGAAKFFPANCTGKINIWWCFGDEDGFEICCGGMQWRDGELPPDWIFGDENTRPRMQEQLPLFFGEKFVVEWDQDAAAVEDGVSGNQPLGLISHDDGGVVARVEAF